MDKIKQSIEAIRAAMKRQAMKRIILCDLQVHLAASYSISPIELEAWRDANSDRFDAIMNGVFTDEVLTHHIEDGIFIADRILGHIEGKPRAFNDATEEQKVRVETAITNMLAADVASASSQLAAVIHGRVN